MRRNLIANYGGTALVAACQLAAIPFYVRFMDKSGWGSLSIILSWATALLVLEGGATLSVSRHFSMRAESRDNIAHYFRRIERQYWLVAGLLLASAVAWFLVQMAGLSTADGGRSKPIALAPLVLALTSAQVFGAVYRGALIGMGAQVRLNAIVATFSLLRYGVSIVVAWLTSDVAPVAASIILVIMLEGGARRIAALRSASTISAVAPDTSPPVHDQTGKSALALILSTLIGACTAQVDRLYLSQTFDPTEFGAYAIAVTLSLSALQMIYPIAQALMPRLSDFSRGSRSPLLSRVGLVILAGACIGLVIFLLYGKILLRWWLRDVDLAAAVYPLLSLHLTGTALNALCIPHHIRLLAQTRDKAILKINASALTMQIASLYFLSQPLGMMAGSLSWLAANGTLLLGYQLTKHEKLNATPN